jgi:hypothetical protein
MDFLRGFGAQNGKGGPALGMRKEREEIEMVFPPNHFPLIHYLGL